MKKLNLGAGNKIEPGYLNHDIVAHRPEIDFAFDLNAVDWIQFLGEDKQNYFEEVKAWDVIEHLNDVINFMDNCWRIVAPGGILWIKACGWQNPNYWVDITHKRAFDSKSFDYFDPEKPLGQEYGFYTNKKWRIVENILDRRNNVVIKLTPIK